MAVYSAEAAAIDGNALLLKIEHQEKLPDSEVEALLAAEKAKPNDSYLHYLVGRYYESVNFGTLAAQEYQQSFDLNRKFSKALVAIARVKLRMLDENGAYAAVTEAIRLFPNDYDVLVTAGLLLQRRGEAQKAAYCYALAMKLAPANAELLTARAGLLYSQNHFYEALQSADQALHLDPNFVAAKAIKGKCLTLSGNFGAAFAPLKEAYEASPSNSDLAQIYSDAAYGAGKYESALAPTLVAMIYKVGTPDKLLQSKRRAAAIMMKLKPEQIRQQIDLAEDKLKTSKSGNLLYFCLGDVFDRLGDKADGMRCYEKGLESDPNYSRGYLRLGEDQEDYLCDFDAALKNYKKALELDAGDPEIKVRYERLSSRIKSVKRDLAWQIKSLAKKAKIASEQNDRKNLHVFPDKPKSNQPA